MSRLEQPDTEATATGGPDRSFVFCTEQRLVVLTGRKATHLEELLTHLQEVSGSCIFYHTHHSYLSHHFEKPRFYNDFANWVSHALQEESLAERLAAIDLLAMGSIRELREALVSTVQKHLQNSGGVTRVSPPGDDLHFCEAKSFIMPTGLVAHDVPEFFTQIAQVSNACLHFHFFESRLRLERPTNDFSQWLTDLGEAKLSRAIDKLNPYVVALDELRNQITTVGRKYRGK